MSIDTLLVLRTTCSASKIKDTLLKDPQIAKLGLARTSEDEFIASERVGLIVRSWVNDDRDLIENGFQTALVMIKGIPGRGRLGSEGNHCAVAAILRLVPGDVCLANQDSSGPDLLRLGQIVYVDRDWYRPENLTDYGYRPDRLVIGIPPEVVASVA